MSSAIASKATWRLPPAAVYPQRPETSENWLTRVENVVAGLPVLMLPRLRRRRLSRIIRSVNELTTISRRLGYREFRAETEGLRQSLVQNGFRDDLVARSFALTREAAARTIGQRHFDVQLLGGYALLKGTIAEMETGEGKTLTATLAAGTAALAGIPVHVITVNDYLARRDAKTMGPIYRALGLSVGTVVHGMGPEERRAAYACDVTYCSNKEVAFDYLRDRIVLGRYTANLHLKLERLLGDARSSGLVMRGLHFAIVDEADSVLIDEARTPLIISSETAADEDERWGEEALQLVESLQPKVDYKILEDEHSIELTDPGRRRLAALAEETGGIWRSTVRREEAARLALSALHLFKRGDHYLVRDGRVQIVDEYTGRLMPDRSWSEGLHQLVEIKEECKVTGRKVPIARISYQRFFRHYQRLAGMTGTAREAARELWAVYHLPVTTISTNRPLRRRRMPERVYATMDGKWQAIAARAFELHRRGRPVLIGTRSVAASETVSGYLTEIDLEHVVLSAAQDHDEADIIARAGEVGRITVATNMAGRGVDIRLADSVVERGGLHVILSERHDASRIDRQLAGRCGRHGEPGTYEEILSLEDPLLETLGGRALGAAARLRGPLFGPGRTRWLFQRAQRRAERLHSRMRRDLLRLDRRLGTLLAFSGEME